MDHACGEQERGLGNERGLGWVVTMRGANSALLRGDSGPPTSLETANSPHYYDTCGFWLYVYVYILESVPKVQAAPSAAPFVHALTASLSAMSTEVKREPPSGGDDRGGSKRPKGDGGGGDGGGGGGGDGGGGAVVETAVAVVAVAETVVVAVVAVAETVVVAVEVAAVVEVEVAAMAEMEEAAADFQHSPSCRTTSFASANSSRSTRAPWLRAAPS